MIKFNLTNKLGGPLPNSKVFEEARIEALQGNNGLCENVNGLQPCVVGRQASNKGHKIIFPLLGTLVLIFLGIFIIFQRKRNYACTNQENNMHNEKVLSIATFDGKAMYKEIIEATQAFDAMFCIGNGGPKVLMLCFALGREDMELSIKRIYHLET